MTAISDDRPPIDRAATLMRMALALLLDEGGRSLTAARLQQAIDTAAREWQQRT